MLKGLGLMVAVAAGLPCFGSSFYVGTDMACFFPTTQSTCTLTSGTSGIGSNLIGQPLLNYTPDSEFDAPDTGGTVELGNFSVTPSLFAGEGGTFDLNVTFTAPGGGGNEFSAGTIGFVTFGFGGTWIEFNPPTDHVYTYPGGSFELSLPSATFFIPNGGTMALDAVITPLGSSAVPEPASLATAGLPLLLLSFALYRRRTSAR